MDDLISREKLKRKFCGHCEDYGNCKEECFDVRIINSMPTAEKKGKWLAGDKMADYPRIPYEPWSKYCSCCREKAYNGDILFDYCPFCGARMEE